MHNSLTSTKVPFLPSHDGKYIGWYTCGPTVYDSAHLGHARCYGHTTKNNHTASTNLQRASWTRLHALMLIFSVVVFDAHIVTFDIIRRILTDYFKYNVFYVMNITDLDDKVSTKWREH